MRGVSWKISLIGFMCAGKSTLGRTLAQHVAVPYNDLDELIQKRFGASISSIFDLQGEAGFRTLETKVLREALVAPGPWILATGGGCIEAKQNRELLRASTFCVFLHPPWKTLRERLWQAANRPLANRLSIRELKELWTLRLPLYQEIAHKTLVESELNALSVDGLCQQLMVSCPP